MFIINNLFKILKYNNFKLNNIIFNNINRFNKNIENNLILIKII